MGMAVAGGALAGRLDCWVAVAQQRQEQALARTDLEVHRGLHAEEKLETGILHFHSGAAPSLC